MTNRTWNFCSALAGRIFGYTCHFFAFLLVARGLGVEEFGIYSFAMEITFLMSIASDAGLSIVTTRELGAKTTQEPSYLGNILVLRLVLALSTTLFVALLSYLGAADSRNRTALLLFGLANVTFFFGNFATAIFRAYERLAFEGIVFALHGLTQLAFMLALTYLSTEAHNLNVVLVGPIVAAILMVIVGYGLVYYFLVKPQFGLSWKVWVHCLREGFPILLALFLIRAYKSVSIITLSHLGSATDIGVFNVAFRLVDTLEVIAMLGCAVLLPVFARLAVASHSELSIMFGNALRIFLLFGLPTATAITVLSEEVIFLLFGKDYLGAVLPLKILSWSMLCYSLSYLLKTLFESVRQQWIWTFVMWIGLVAAIVLNPLLVAWTGPTGASFALLLANITILAVSTLLARQNISFVNLHNSCRKIGVSSILMAITLYLLRSLHLSLIIPIGALIYALSLFLLGELERETNRLTQILAKAPAR